MPWDVGLQFQTDIANEAGLMLDSTWFLVVIFFGRLSEYVLTGTDQWKDGPVIPSDRVCRSLSSVTRVVGVFAFGLGFSP